MINKLDRKRIGRSEELLESAYWDMDARKAKGQDERTAFKIAVRGRFPQWFNSAEDVQNND